MLLTRSTALSRAAADGETNPFFLAAFDGAERTLEALLSTDLTRSFPLGAPSAAGFSLLSAALPICRGERGTRILGALLAAGADPDAIEPLAPEAESYRHRALKSVFDAAESQGGGSPIIPIGLVALAADWRASKTVWSAISPEAKRAMSAHHGAAGVAAHAGNIEALQELAALGASMNQLDLDGELPLSRVQDSQTLKALLALGADLNAVNAKGASALQIMMGAQSRGMAEKEMAKIAVAWISQAPASAAPGGSCASDAALAKGAFSALSGKNKNAARQAILALAERSAEQTDAQGRGLMWAAAQAGNFAEVRRLLKFGADPFAVASDGSSAFQALAYSRSEKGWGSRFDATAEQIVKELSSKARSPIPWGARNAQGFCLAESFCPNDSALGSFWRDVAPRALASGWDPTEERPGRPLFLQGALAHYCGSFNGAFSGDIHKTFLPLLDKLPLAPSRESSLAFLNLIDSDAPLLRALAGDPINRHRVGDETAERLADALRTHALVCAQHADLSHWSPSPDALKLCPEFCAAVEAMALKQSSSSARGPGAPSASRLRV